MATQDQTSTRGRVLNKEGDVLKMDRIWAVSIGPRSHMNIPSPNWLWQLVHVRPEPDRSTKCDDRMLVVSLLEDYLHLIEICSVAAHQDSALRDVQPSKRGSGK